MSTHAGPKGHYLQITLPEGKESVRRVYVPLVSETETIAEATDRWVEEQLGDRQRNRDKVGNQLRASIVDRRITRPSAWYREHRLGAHAEPGTTPYAKVRRGVK